MNNLRLGRMHIDLAGRQASVDRTGGRTGEGTDTAVLKGTNIAVFGKPEKRGRVAETGLDCWWGTSYK